MVKPNLCKVRQLQPYNVSSETVVISPTRVNACTDSTPVCASAFASTLFLIGIAVD